jgi:hypothetical protein
MKLSQDYAIAKYPLPINENRWWSHFGGQAMTRVAANARRNFGTRFVKRAYVAGRYFSV